MTTRYTVSRTAGSRGGATYAVLDNHRDEAGNKARISFHLTFRQAQIEAKRLNAADRALPPLPPGFVRAEPGDLPFQNEVTP